MSNHTNVFPTLETERLQLRQIEESDASSLMNYLADPEVMEYYGLAPFQSIKDALNEISWYQSIFKENTGIRWGITLKGEDEIIGSCGFLNMCSQNYRTEVGYELSKQYWGKGIAGEALDAVLSYGFESMNLQRIQALIEPPNVASIRLVEKHGFVREGLLRNFEFTGNKFDDLYMYALLKQDFGKRI